MTLITKQLLIHQFDFPKEVLNIIKEFAFYDIIQNTKKNKNKIISSINSTKWSGKCDFDDSVWHFWIEDDPSSSQLQANFCKNCGDYASFYENIKFVCRCDNPSV